jgi:hypothetical protein
MPSKIIDFSARSKIFHEEPFHLHFWECKPSEYLEFLKNPRKTLEKMKINIPQNCRIQTTMQNHDWLSSATNGLTDADNGTIVCNVGTGNVAWTEYVIVSYAHDHGAIGKHKKELLHGQEEEEQSTPN